MPDAPGTALATGTFGMDNLIAIGLNSPLVGDYNNSQVGLGDLNLVLFNWNSVTVPPEWQNFIPAGAVGLPELNTVLFNWGNSQPAIGVPEPGCFGVLAFGRMIV